MAQVTSYAPELWEYFGLTPVTVWDLEASHFFALAKQIDRQRIEDRKREAKR